MTIELIGTAEIAQLLGVSRTYTTDRVTKRPDFPKPVIVVSQKIKRWDRREVLSWMTSTHKSPTDAVSA